MAQVVLSVAVALFILAVYAKIIQKIIQRLNREGQNMLKELTTLQSVRFAILSKTIDLVEVVNEQKYQALQDLLHEQCTAKSIFSVKERNRFFDRLYAEIMEIAKTNTALAQTQAYCKLVETTREYQELNMLVQSKYNKIATKLNKTIEIRPNRLIATYTDIRKMPSL